MLSPEKFRQHKLKEYKEVYEDKLSNLPRLLAKYWDAYQIAEEWTSQDPTRSAIIDDSLPIYMKLGLGKNDTVTKAILFMEQVEEEYGEFSQDIRETDDSVTVFIGKNLTIFFTIGRSTKCEIVYEKESELKETIKAKRILCY